MVSVSGVVLVALSIRAQSPLDQQFKGRKAAYVRRATTPGDWHRSQIAYGDGSRIGASPTLDEHHSCDSTLPSSVSPADFGGDPTGESDSSAAFKEAVSVLRRLCRPAADPNPGSRPERLDCGGAELSLRGGWFAVSEPVRIPAGMGNLWLRGGTISALPNFHPRGSHVVIFGDNCTQHIDDKGGCAANIGVEQLTVNARKYADGCLSIDHVQFATVGPGIMLLGFSSYGISAFGSGGTVIQGVFAGEYGVGDPMGHRIDALSGTAVYLAAPQHDGFVLNTIIWSAKVGVVVHNAATQMSGVHPWNYVTDPQDGHQTSAVDGIGLGMVVSNGGARVENCYLDTVPLLINVTGDSAHVVVTGNLFLKNSSVILSGPRWEKPTARTGVARLIITDNVFLCNDNKQFGRCESDAIVLDETGSRFGSIIDTRVAGNEVDPDAGYRATIARRSATVHAAEIAELDFTGALLFPQAAVANGTVGCVLSDGPPVAFSIRAASPDAPLKLVVLFADQWTGTVGCTVDQSMRSRVSL